MSEIKTPVKVIDGPCGVGKTSWAIQHMNENVDTRYIFITPFLDEVERVKVSCRKRNFKEPSGKNGSKSEALLRLLDHGCSIVSTHALFEKLNERGFELIKMGGYTLILDEVMEVLKQEKISNHDLEMLRHKEYLIIDEKTGIVEATEKAQSYRGKFKELLFKAMAGRLIYVNTTLLLWQFPADIFKAFREVYNLTYIFDGQIQKYYYDLNSVLYDPWSVIKEGDENYKIVPYLPGIDKNFRADIKKLIHIHEDKISTKPGRKGSLNAIGDIETALSLSSYRNANRKKKDSLSTNMLQANTRNYFQNHLKSKSADAMWTCFKDYKDKIKGNGYAKGFVSLSMRATNAYKSKKDLAYLVNRYPRMPIKSYFESHRIEINKDQYALSEMIQWIFRSQIRDGKPINLYIPSKRMRTILKNWMDV